MFRGKRDELSARTEQLHKYSIRLHRLDEKYKELSGSSAIDYEEFFKTYIKLFKCNIDVNDILLTNIRDLYNLPYKNELASFTNECNEYLPKESLILNTLDRLWRERYGKGEIYNILEMYRKYEELLYVNEKYRDHFDHQFYVFLCGLPILDKFYNQLKNSYSDLFTDDVQGDSDIGFSWLIASTFHDVGYVIQLYDDWMSEFLSTFYCGKEKIKINIDDYINENQEYITKLISFNTSLVKRKKWKYSGINRRNPNLKNFIKARLKNESYGADHGVISSLLILKKTEEYYQRHDEYRFTYKDGLFTTVIMPSSHAIALHTLGVKYLLSLEADSYIYFEKDPLTFLLIFCDTIQEWGRLSNKDIKCIVNLSEYSISEKNVKITLSYHYDSDLSESDISIAKTAFGEKKKEVEEVMGRLRANLIDFTIKLDLWDNNNIKIDKYKRSSKKYKVIK